jgi:hypothetical protein
MGTKKFITSALTIAFLSTIAFVSFNSGFGEKVTVIHNGNEIEISVDALEAHLAHGDTIKGCFGDC